MRRLPAAALVLAATAASAQDVAVREAADAYVALPAVQDVIDDFLSPQALMAELAEAVPPETDRATMQLLADAVAQELRALRDDVEAAMAGAAAETYTAEELQALTEFHATEIGAAVLAKQDAFTARYRDAIAPELERLRERLFSRAGELARE